MKRILFALVVLMSVAAPAVAVDMWTNTITGEISPWPPRLPGDRLSVPAEWYIEQGWVQFSLAQQADWDAARAAEIEAAAAFTGPDPEVFVPALDDEGQQIGTARLVVRAATWELVPLTNSASPQRIWEVQREEFRGRIAKSAAEREKVRAAKSKGNGLGALADRVDALEEPVLNK